MADQLKLFDIPEQKKEKPEFRCRNCKHIRRHQYNASYFYCMKRYSRRTISGFLKIKANNASCIQFEKLE